MMSLTTFVQAMPKFELNLRLEGSVSAATLLMLAEQNEVLETNAQVDEWTTLLNQPPPHRLGEIVRTTSSWLQQPDDLTRVAYDVGVQLAKQNIRYAEVCVNPALYTNLELEGGGFLAALNDGRDRAERAWKVRMNWILAIPRDEPRRADEYVRLAALVGSKKSGVVGLGLLGDEAAQPIGQFERAFKQAEKKDVNRLPHAGQTRGVEGVRDVLTHLAPQRIANGWGVLDDESVGSLLLAGGVPLVAMPGEARFTEKTPTLADYPLRQMLDAGLVLALGADMPVFYGLNSNELYQAVVDDMGFSVDDLEMLALNTVRASTLPAEDKQAHIEMFTEEYRVLRDQHIEAEVEEQE